MLSAIARISVGSVAGTSSTQRVSSDSVRRHTSGRFNPPMRGARAASDRREPPQAGHAPCFKNRSTRFIPFSSVTLASAFSTV